MTLRGTLYLLCILAVSCGIVRRGSTVVIPQGFAGWVRIEYQVPGAAELPVEGGQYLIVIPKSGFAATSSKPESGFGDDQYFLVDDHGVRSALTIEQGDPKEAAIRARKMFTIGAPESPSRTFGAFFVGTESAYREAPKDPTTLALP